MKLGTSVVVTDHMVREASRSYYVALKEKFADSFSRTNRWSRSARGVHLCAKL